MATFWNTLQGVFTGRWSTGSTNMVTAFSLQLRIISFNIRYATTSPFTNERPWVERQPLVSNQLLHEVRFASDSLLAADGPPTYGAAFVCLQEVLHNQLVDVLAALNHQPRYSKGGDEHNEQLLENPEWAYIGVGRDDGGKEGEYSPIFYPLKAFELLHDEAVWLSPTPDKPSKGWDAGSIRILTVGVFEHKQTKQRLVVANTHLDNEGSKSRLESVKIILSTLRRVHRDWSQYQKLGILLTGDFNSFPEQEAYVAMRDDGWMSDLHETIEARTRHGNQDTFSGFEPEKQTDEQGRIDYIWHGPAEHAATGQVLSPWASVGYAVLSNIFDNKIYLSDHRAVVGDLRLNYF